MSKFKPPLEPRIPDAIRPQEGQERPKAGKFLVIGDGFGADEMIVTGNNYVGDTFIEAGKNVDIGKAVIENNDVSSRPPKPERPRPRADFRGARFENCRKAITVGKGVEMDLTANGTQFSQVDSAIEFQGE